MLPTAEQLNSCLGCLFAASGQNTTSPHHRLRSQRSVHGELLRPAWPLRDSTSLLPPDSPSFSPLPSLPSTHSRAQESILTAHLLPCLAGFVPPVRHRRGGASPSER
ncbi:hypothetical protein BO94DRAFT_244861 [Aspergillus sclerotioniger CBS 115572]|uniref:Uncharacterized protein n=1 Tax=Aspergillus sclerotioniger CBS 115572 TaxID=1450535 RepID=A0A317VHE3_9EURO|nr:hypothetical protein BO94DRAFT_244861 [Aspergillus sclerotioniger CBS 115572]PWY72458.1 hypothetical protein BO94DRAFT_244861 [Aspergillus sclerotioniger CBS 115572]